MPLVPAVSWRDHPETPWLLERPLGHVSRCWCARGREGEESGLSESKTTFPSCQDWLRDLLCPS